MCLRFLQKIYPTPSPGVVVVYQTTLTLTYMFYSYLINKPKVKRSLTVELIAATFGSIFGGFGMIFFIMWTGIFL